LAETWIRFFHPARTLTAAASAVAAARALGSVERFGWSAYRYIQAVGRTRDGDRRTAVEGAVAVADEALGLLGDDLPGLRARILAELVMLHEERGEASDAMSSEAVALARMSGDSDALGVVLATRCALLRGSPRIREHLALADELVRGAPPDGWDGWRNGYSQRAMARLALGDRRGFEADLKACGRLGVERHFWWFRWIAAMWTAGLGLLDGRFDEVEGLASHARGLAPAGLVGDEFFLRQMFRLHVERGDVAGATAVGRELVSSWPDNALHQAMLVAARAGFEGVDAARPAFERFADEGLGPMAPERWPVTLAYRAKVALALGGTERAGDLYDALRPYRAQAVIGGMADGCMGAADRYLGMLATATGNFDDAEAHFQAALTLESGLSSPPLLARTRFWYGRMLLLRARDRDVPEAKALLARALETAETLGMCGLADEVRAWC
jgi:tetratricopeptide (TPR) repeat protein